MTKFLGTMVIVLMVGLTTGCPDDSGDSDADCTPACGSGYTCVSGTCVPDGGDADADGGADADSDGDADGDADADGDVPTGSLTVTSTPVQGAAIELDGNPSGEVTNYTFSSIEARTHSILLSLAGRLQVSDTGELYQPTEVNVTQDGTNVNIVLYYDLTGRWQLTEANGSPVTDGEIVDVTMRGYESGLETFCPTTSVWANGFDPLGTLCLEGDDTLSLCKDHASSCGDLSAEGQILDDGRRVEFTKHQLGVDYSAVYTKID
jgi:hypothetical protein